MKKLISFDLLKNHVFYRSYYILDYLMKENISELDKKAIKATIMDALVYKGLIDPKTEFLDLENMVIDNDPNHYHYETNPDVAGVPLWMKEELRKKCIYIIGGIPVSMKLAIPAGDVHYCIYDPNTAVSSIFDDFTFYDVFYTSPTRGVRIDNKRPFVEVNIHGENYLVDILTKRIFKSSFFKENYGFEIVNSISKKDFNKKREERYMLDTEFNMGLAAFLAVYDMINSSNNPKLSELKYEIEMTKTLYPGEWEKYKRYKSEMNEFLYHGKQLTKGTRKTGLFDNNIE